MIPWVSGFLLGANLVLIAWGFSDGKSLTSMVAPILGIGVAIGIQVIWSSKPMPDAGDDQTV